MSNSDFIKRPPISALLIDISGTLHVGGNPTPGAVDSFRRLRESSVPFRLCSNTSNQSTASLIRQLGKMGFDLDNRHGSPGVETSKSDKHRLVWTSIGVIAKVIREKGLKRPYLLLSESAREEVVSELTRDTHPPTSSGSESSEYDSVVVGLAPSLFDYDRLNTAFRILKGEHEPASAAGSAGNEDIPLIAANKSRYIEKENGLALGTGPFVAALETASGVTAHVVGKPTKAFFQMVIDDFANGAEGDNNNELNAQERGKGKIAVIGDDVEADLGGGALELELWGVLVKTGKYRAGDEQRPGLVPPDEVCDSLSSFIDSLLAEQEQK